MRGLRSGLGFLALVLAIVGARSGEGDRLKTIEGCSSGCSCLTFDVEGGGACLRERRSEDVDGDPEETAAGFMVMEVEVRSVGRSACCDSRLVGSWSKSVGGCVELEEDEGGCEESE